MNQWTTASVYPAMKNKLNERDRRLYFASEALRIGHGGISQIAKLSGISRVTIAHGIEELENDVDHKGRIRKAGGGRKKIVQKDSDVLLDLENIMQEDTKGDPMTFLKYTTKSLAHIEHALNTYGHSIKKSTIATILHSLTYSLKPNKKNIEGESHVDRNLQFQHINKQCKLFEEQKNPIISIDCKKKEKLGNFKNNGSEWTKKGRENEMQVNAYDFTSLAHGQIAPYGIYDVLKKKGFVNVGIDHDTAAFAVESIRRWWTQYGKQLYPDATGILITADGGGSNGVRNRLFKRELQKLVNEIKIPITLCHYPPATSKWNVIEHQLFSFISINWRAKPLTSLAVVLELISHTTTKSGLKVTAIADANRYQIGIKISDKELKALNITRDTFHGEWNYMIKPQHASIA